MIKLFLIALLGTHTGNQIMEPNSAYSVESGVQIGCMRLGLDLAYLRSNTAYPSFRLGEVTLIPIMGEITIVPQIRSRVKPYIGYGWGKVLTDRELNRPQTKGWRESEEVEEGTATMLKGGLEISLTKHIAIVLGARQLYFKTRLIEHRMEYPKFSDSIDYQRSRDIDLDTLMGQAGLRFIF